MHLPSPSGPHEGRSRCNFDRKSIRVKGSGAVNFRISTLADQLYASDLVMGNMETAGVSNIVISNHYPESCTDQPNGTPKRSPNPETRTGCTI